MNGEKSRLSRASNTLRSENEAFMKAVLEYQGKEEVLSQD